MREQGKPHKSYLLPSGQWKREGSAWRKLMKERMRQIDPKCRHCGERDGRDLHHIVPRSHGGMIYDTNNLTLLCKPCHREIEHDLDVLDRLLVAKVHYLYHVIGLNQEQIQCLFKFDQSYASILLRTFNADGTRYRGELTPRQQKRERNKMKIRVLRGEGLSPTQIREVVTQPSKTQFFRLYREVCGEEQ